MCPPPSPVRQAKANDTAKRRASAPAWQAELQGAVRSASALAKRLRLPALPEHVDRNFPLLAPESFIKRMRPGDPQDPLLLQILPTPAEAHPTPGYTPDPVGELEAIATSAGLLRKYQGRALIIATGACPVHCRYCFRRHFPYSAQTAAGQNWASALQQLAQDASIGELILSGGDPLMLPDAKLAALIRQADSIPHLHTIRIHTRMPVIIPSRITGGLIKALAATDKRLCIALHINHPQELDAEVAAALAPLPKAGVTLLNQSVLLRRINDSSQTLAALSLALWQAQILPYYLHLLDKVAGAAHFNVPAAKARRLMQTLRATLPGYLVPRLVKEVPGAPSKHPL